MLSETKKLRPDRNVMDFLGRLPRQTTFVSSLSLGELRRGGLRLARTNTQGGQNLLDWIEQIQTRFSERVLPVTTEIALLWGDLSADRTRPVANTLLAATAIGHCLTLVTRNTKDVEDLPVSVVNPWQP